MKTVFDALKAMGKATSVELARDLISVVKKY